MPLLVELAATALIALVAVTRKPIARLVRAAIARRADRRLAGRHGSADGERPVGRPHRSAR